MYSLVMKLLNDDGVIVSYVLRNEKSGCFELVYRSNIRNYSLRGYIITSDLKLRGRDVHTCKFSNLMSMYHGSRNGIRGKIRPCSNDNSDFRRGFYMGDSLAQASSWVSNSGWGAEVYNILLDRTNLSFIDLNRTPELWALYIARNRNMLAYEVPPRLRAKFRELDSYDVVHGLIADDRMTDAFKAFSVGTINFEGLKYCLGYVRLGSQVTLRTQKACDCVVDKCTVKPDRGIVYPDMTDLIRRARQMFRNKGKELEDLVDEWD